MFFNAWAPPTEGPTGVTSNKLIYAHYCSAGNVQTLLDVDHEVFSGAVVLCKYGGGAGRADKAKNVKPHGAQAVLIRV